MILLEVNSGLEAAPDHFWYWLATALATAIVILLSWYLKRQEKTTDNLVDSVNKLTTMVAVHDKDIIDIEEDVKALKSKVYDKY